MTDRAKRRHIVGMGGGGFLFGARNAPLDDFVLGLAQRSVPRVCYVPTASGDAQDRIDLFYEVFPESRATASHLGLFRREIEDLRAHLFAQDVVYVGGGNTANMLVVWRLHGVDRILREAWDRGIVLAGFSAGLNCWFESGVTDSFGPESVLADGLGFLPDSACPHYDSEVGRRPFCTRAVRDRKLAACVAVDDDAAVHYVDTELVEVVSSSVHAHAYRLELGDDGEVRETALETRCLAADTDVGGDACGRVPSAGAADASTQHRFGHVAVQAIDMEQSITFYRDTLGLRQARTIRDEGNWIEFFDLGWGELELFAPRPYTERAPTERSYSRSGICHFALLTADFYSTRERLEQRGAEVIRGPACLPDGTQFLFVRGPNGEEIEIKEDVP